MKIFCRYLLLAGLFFLPACLQVPSFAPERRIVKQYGNFEWVNYRGILDQHFSDNVLMKNDKKFDTVCVSDNIASLSVKDNSLLLGFYGPPSRNGNRIKIADSIKNFRIIVDTTFLKSQN